MQMTTCGSYDSPYQSHEYFSNNLGRALVTYNMYEKGFLVMDFNTEILEHHRETYAWT